VCTFLANREVAQRQAKAAQSFLAQIGYPTDIGIINDQSNPIQKGSSITLLAKTDTDVIIGADAIGEIQKMAEDVGREAAQTLSTELTTQPTVDEFLADMLIPYIALSEGRSVFLTRCITEHIEANIWLMEKMLNVKFNLTKHNSLYRIEKTATDNDDEVYG